MKRGLYNTFMESSNASAQCINLLQDGCAQLALEVPESRLHALLHHLELLRRWNARKPLTAESELPAMLVRHVLDSLVLLPFLSGRRVLDVGSGGGFPGLPLAILEPERDWMLLDRRKWSAEFLRYAAGQLKLENVEVASTRLESYQPPRPFDTLVSRAVAPLGGLYRISRHLHHRRSRLLAMVGRIPTGAIARLPPAVRRNSRVEPLHVPYLDAERHAVIIDF